MKIAIFGGSFNPVHREHVNIVKAAKAVLSLDKVIIMPSNITPKKSGKITASVEDRLKMCHLAFDSIEGVMVSDYEIRQGGISYSYLTCRALKERYPKDELFFILGADMLESFPHWKHPEEILKCVKLAVCARENTEGLENAIKSFKTTFGYEIVEFGYVGAMVSSTKIRTLAAFGESIDEYVDESTANYINKNAIYRLKNLQSVKNYLKAERWAHTVRVAIMMAQNCSRLVISEERAITAAALHDCAKYLELNSPELEGFTCPEGVPFPVIHQYAGAYVAQHTFLVTDEEILDAIRYHTSGKENMSPLGKLLFLCDMLEEGRDFEGVNELRKIFARSMDEALYASLERQIEYLKERHKPIYPLSLKAYEYLKENRNGK